MKRYLHIILALQLLVATSVSPVASVSAQSEAGSDDKPDSETVVEATGIALRAIADTFDAISLGSALVGLVTLATAVEIAIPVSLFTAAAYLSTTSDVLDIIAALGDSYNGNPDRALDTIVSELLSLGLDSSLQNSLLRRFPELYNRLPAEVRDSIFVPLTTMDQFWEHLSKLITEQIPVNEGDQLCAPLDTTPEDLPLWCDPGTAPVIALPINTINPMPEIAHTNIVASDEDNDIAYAEVVFLGSSGIYDGPTSYRQYPSQIGPVFVNFVDLGRCLCTGPTGCEGRQVRISATFQVVVVDLVGNVSEPAQYTATCTAY